MKTLDRLKEHLRGKVSGGVALAFSGGVDSSLLLAVLKQLSAEKPFALQALTMHTIFHRAEELEQVTAITSRLGVTLKLFRCDPLAIPEVKYNPPDRCYWCKRYIFTEITEYASEHELGTVMDGTNADDEKVYRPGRRALRELKVSSPLSECGISKAEVRAMAQELGLECASKPASPCMATRFEYGTLLTEEYIRKVVEGEDLIRALLPRAENIRLRVHADIARIEIPGEWLAELTEQREKVVAGLKNMGFQFITLDLEGFRSGSMDGRKIEKKLIY